MTPKRVAENILYPVAALGAVFGIWAAVSAAKNNPVILPPLGEIFAELGRLLGDADSWKAAGMTLLRILGSFALSFTAAALLAAAGVAVKPLHKFLSPIVTVLQAAPTMAVILLAVIWLDGSEVPLLIGFLICFPLLYSSIRSAIEHVDKDLLQAAELYRVSWKDKMTHIYAPEMFPLVADGARSTVSLAVKVVIAAEVLAQTKTSIGLEMQFASILFNVSTLLAWTILAIALSFLLEGAAAGIKKLWEVRRG